MQSSTFFHRLGLLVAEILLYIFTVGVLLTFTYLLIDWLDGLTVWHIGNIGADFGNAPWAEALISYLPQCVIFTAAIIFLRKTWFRRDMAEAGFSTHQMPLLMGKGFGLGVALIGMGFLILLLFRQVGKLSLQWDSYLFWGYCVLFFFQSFSEEIMNRSFLVPTLAARFGAGWAIGISALVFTLLHFANPNFTWIGAANLFLTGVLFGLLFIKYQSVWVCTGLHWSWNFVQATVLDFNVSGIDVYSFINFERLTSLDWLSGGGFGFEGSIVSVALLGLVWWRLEKPQLFSHPTSSKY